MKERKEERGEERRKERKKVKPYPFDLVPKVFWLYYHKRIETEPKKETMDAFKTGGG